MNQKSKIMLSTDIRGFTLIEGIVAGSLTVILGVVLMTVFQMTTNQVARGALNTKIQMQYETVVTQIGHHARTANAIMHENETYPPAATAVAYKDSLIFMCDLQGDTIGGFRIRGTDLNELEKINGTWTWLPFKTGSDTVQVTSGSNFDLTADRKWVICRLSVFSSARGCSLPDTVASKQESFKCRN